MYKWNGRVIGRWMDHPHVCAKDLTPKKQSFIYTRDIYHREAKKKLSVKTFQKSMQSIRCPGQRCKKLAENENMMSEMAATCASTYYSFFYNKRNSFRTNSDVWIEKERHCSYLNGCIKNVFFRNRTARVCRNKPHQFHDVTLRQIHI